MSDDCLRCRDSNPYLPILPVLGPFCQPSMDPRYEFLSRNASILGGPFLYILASTKILEQSWFSYPHTRALGPVQTLNARPSCLTAAAGTELAGTELMDKSIEYHEL